MFHTVNGCIMRVYWFYSLLSFSVVHSSSFFLAFITVAVVCVMDLVVWNKRGLDWIGLDKPLRREVGLMPFILLDWRVVQEECMTFARGHCPSDILPRTVPPPGQFPSP